MRKRMQSNDPNAPNIDLEMLRASARQADMEKNAKKQAQQAQPPPKDTLSQHQSSFQVLPPVDVLSPLTPSLPPPPSASSSHQRIPPPPPPSSSLSTPSNIPQQGWAPHSGPLPPASAVATAPPPLQHQPYSSYMKSGSNGHHPPSR